MNDVEKMMAEAKSVIKGHFLLSSGRHSDTYCQMALLLQYPKYCEALAEKLATEFKGLSVNVVLGVAIGGMILGYELSRALGVRNIFAERQDKVMKLRRGFCIEKGENIVICEDVITTGGSAAEVCRLVEGLGGNIVGIACLMERGDADLGYPVKSLLKKKVKSYEPAECPLCKQGLPVEKQGSR